jgi:hypothetical protein
MPPVSWPIPFPYFKSLFGQSTLGSELAHDSRNQEQIATWAFHGTIEKDESSCTIE